MSDNPEAKRYFDIAMKCCECGDFESAINNFSKTIEIDPNYIDAYNKRGVMYCQLGKYEEAIKDFNKVIEIDPNFKGTYNNRGLSYAGIGKSEEAMKDYNKAIEIDPNFIEAYNNRGFLYGSIGKYEEAIKDCNKAIEIDSNYKTAYCNRGNIYFKLNKYEEAVDDYNKVIEIDPNFNGAYYNRGIFYIKLKNFTNVKQDFKKYLEIRNKKETIDTNLIIFSNNTINKIKDNLLSYIENILKECSMNDNEKLILVELIYFCYQLIEKIKIKDKNFKLTHYTKSGTLKLLLGKKDNYGKLRLNNAIYMNDPEEGQTFIKLLSQYNNKLNNIFHRDIDIKNYTYLTCFCPYDKRDMLPMWVHYGDNGKGIGLVFNQKFFENQDLYNVQYIDSDNFDINSVDENIKGELKQIFDILSTDTFVKSENMKFLEYTNIIINYVSYFFKDKAYEYESEVRMVQFRDYESEDLLLNDTCEIPRLYIEHKKEITAEFCEEIVVGPKGSYEEIATYGKYMGVKKCSKSKIKYR